MHDVRQAIVALGFAVLSAAAAHSSAVQAADRDAIWKIVHNLCLQNMQKNSDPAPCSEVRLSQNGKGGFAILKDIKGSAHYLLVPTDAIAGIESPKLLGPNRVNWFDLAWQARGFLDQSTSRMVPADDVALAVNSVSGRGQDQLHIHISCINPKIKSKIYEQIGSIGQSWSRQTVRLDGNYYYAERINRSDLSGFNPFQAVADGIPGAKDEMGRLTIIVIGAGGKDTQDGFFIFVGKSDDGRGDRGKAEDLLDNNCSHLDR